MIELSSGDRAITTVSQDLHYQETGTRIDPKYSMRTMGIQTSLLLIKQPSKK